MATGLREVVLVFGWRRPAFLAACLRRLVAIDDGHRYYVVTLDRGADAESARVALGLVERFPERAMVRTIEHGYAGNSCAVLSSLGFAWEHLEADTVHLIEEDVFVAAGYFDYHRSALDAAPVFAVSACANQDFPGDMPELPHVMYLWGSYQSLGVSLRPGSIEMILEHAVPAYFKDPVRYCAKVFPGSKVPRVNAEQDGLISRIVEHEKLMVGFPCMPRAYHAGFTGYHCEGDMPEGATDDVARQLLAMSARELNARALSHPNHTTVDLEENLGVITTWAVQAVVSSTKQDI